MTSGNWRAGMLACLTVAAAAAGSLAPAAPATARPVVTAVSVPVLRWHPCAGSGAFGFQCATARVPLDYTVPAGRAIQIAVIRHLATDPAHRLGSLFVNFGGPGVPGVVDLPLSYHLFPAGLRQRFDIVSFDPRGAGQSTAVRCFATAAAEKRFYAALPQGFPAGSSQTRQWIDDYAALGQRCQRRAGYLLPHLATADVARDMDLLRRAVADPSMNYLGISYGTYLGATYASLFPGVVRAMVLDGVVDPTAWARPERAGRVPLGTALRIGTDLGSAATLNQFLRLCGEASTSRCAFSTGTAQATRAKYAILLRRLRSRPAIVTVPPAGKVIYTYASLVDTVASRLHYVWPVLVPGQGWAGLARLLEQVWQASGSRAPARPPGTAGLYPGSEQKTAIICADSPNPRNPASYPAQAAFGYRRSGPFGPDNAWMPEPCSTWPATDAHGYYGPWNRWTASPILVIGNRYDPATPYADAVSLTRELARARLLTLDGYGHTAFMNPSTCIHQWETAYFTTGALPPPGTVCHQDKQPFQDR